MPYKLGKHPSCPSSKPFAVLKDDGSLVQGGCHATRGQALDHQRALMVNVSDAARDLGEKASEAALAHNALARVLERHETREQSSIQAVAATIEVPEPPDAYAKDYSTEQRRKMAKAGSAMPDGSFPINDCQDVANARQSIGRTPESRRPAVMAHINKRAKTLGCSN